MFKQPLKLITPSSLNAINVYLRQEASCSTTTAPVKKWKWDLVSAVCLERHPIITKPMTDLEQRFQESLNQIEFENSYKSDHELKVEQDNKLKGQPVNDDTEVTIKQTAQDFEDAYKEEFEKFNFASRITEADEKKITNSLKRKLDNTLLLLTEQKRGTELLWLPPQGIRNEGESMRQAAERALIDSCGSDLTVKFYGNAPIGFYKYLYPRAKRSEGSDGAKVFYFLAKYEKGTVPEKLNHQWLDRKELTEILHKDIRKCLFQFLIPEESN
ncbi:39S ribosomal protein L46, mitochondrial [Belonocnema kinseyi]|uniref:39S ribosomal protein L46, mitochondrial n=1 Tax=Belonocnema kinseyi TaxID=2817044 RepID=UPI00143E029E|nr:39S ribosomal protein L46, mitochondrial [Belonocnema kinseyi]